MIAFLLGLFLAGAAGAVVCLRPRKRYAELIGRMEAETVSWQRVELPVVCRVDGDDKFSGLAEAVCGLVNKVRYLTQEVQLTSQQVRAASDQMDGAVRSTADLATLFDEMNRIAGTLQQTGMDLERDFAGSEAAVKESGAALELVLRAIRDIAQSNSALKDQIQTLETAVERVRSISGSIGEISDQTKLLALNAAIEAARAGEAGRGFAVVAQEIGKLSDHTATAISKTADVLQKMKQDVDAVVGSITASRDSSTTASKQLANVEGEMGLA